jgi:hypothetical protein
MADHRITNRAASICALPLVRRIYFALVGGLAVFLATLAVLREPFRGYLAEVRISGPPAEGLDLDAAARWLKQSDSKVVVIAGAARQGKPRSVIRMTCLERHPAAAIARLDELADRWLYQFLPQQLQAYRHESLANLRSTVAARREQEDADRDQVERLRQRQLAQLLTAQAHEHPAAAPSALPAVPPQSFTGPPAEGDAAIRRRLAQLQLELTQLLARFTDAHPQVIELRSQIESLSQQVAPEQQQSPSPPAVGPELIPAPAADRQADGGNSVRPAAQHFISAEAAAGKQQLATLETAGELSAAVGVALARLSQSSRARQEAENRLSDRMQVLTTQPTGAEWNAEPAHIVTRLGGTPRCATLALAAILAAIGGVVMFRGSAALVLPPRLESPAQLASALELPVIGNTAHLRGAAAPTSWRMLTPGRVRALAHVSEAIVALAVAACLLAILVDPSLARQVVADPFGTLSEVIGRFQG